MVQLYVLSADCERLRQLADQAGTPEEEAMFMDALRTVQGDIETKADRMAALMTEFQAEADAIQHEEQRMYARRKAIEANRARMSDYIKRCLVEAGVDKVKGPRFSLWVQANPPRVQVDSEDQIPSGFWKIAKTLDKQAVSLALRSGAAVPGARLEESSSLRIR